jgi:hypothetical protein
MIRASIKALTVSWGLLFVFTGCTPAGPEIKGTVTLDDKPLAKARLTFEPLASNPAGAEGGAVAVCDDAGKFEIVPQAEGQTLKPGNYAVTVSRKTDAQGNAPPPEEYGMLEASGTLVESVPAAYLAVPAGGEPALKAEIKDGPNDLKFDLKSQP